MTLVIENVDIALPASFLDRQDWDAAYLDPAGGDIHPRAGRRCRRRWR